jgi:hypothetical protein
MPEIRGRRATALTTLLVDRSAPARTSHFFKITGSARV